MWTSTPEKKHRGRNVSLFEDLKSGGEAALDALCARKVEEGLDLEFKSKDDPSKFEPSRTDQKYWGKCVSALSNAEGGVLVWGIKTRKDADNIDRADKLEPIAEPERF